MSSGMRRTPTRRSTGGAVRDAEMEVHAMVASGLIRCTPELRRRGDEVVVLLCTRCQRKCLKALLRAEDNLDDQGGMNHGFAWSRIVFQAPSSVLRQGNMISPRRQGALSLVFVGWRRAPPFNGMAGQGWKSLKMKLAAWSRVSRTNLMLSRSSLTTN
ncbi:hypothetical protein AYL99_11600 [Fonsecaea erecta]|uniref:Uncharacterized protein n=1 Tax=Fonsecaea erecta TaxID=1367422 RepID=A0A178Z3M5_9EURO|nr:hypothetical protein AYL99_11600 [Fonsecaea erecta]OAP54066.1 hypothetical protein AYL99_11600 [Fonsecaea erecta]